MWARIRDIHFRTKDPWLITITTISFSLFIVIFIPDLPLNDNADNGIIKYRSAFKFLSLRHVTVITGHECNHTFYEVFSLLFLL